MSETADTIIVGLVIAASVAGTAWKIYRSTRKGDCGCGKGSDCDGCRRDGCHRKD